MLKACSSSGAIQEGAQVHAALITRGFQVLQDTVVMGALIDLYVKCGHLFEARKLFDQIEQKYVTSWSALVLGYAQEGDLLEGMELFRQLREGGNQLVDEFLLSGLIGVFADFAFIEQGKQLHSYAIKVPSGLHLSVANTIFDMYLKCGLVEEAESPKEEKVKEEAGQNWVEINKEIHIFYVRFALHDVEEESKEESLRVHNEKLAIGLALLSGMLVGFTNLRMDRVPVKITGDVTCVMWLRDYAPSPIISKRLALRKAAELELFIGLDGSGLENKEILGSGENCGEREVASSGHSVQA
ncbi:hypothetical protein Ancab_002244 [Ancistrocladus abbreviatus]